MINKNGNREDYLDIVYAPWSDDEVAKLKAWQENDMMHEYTCQCGNILTPTNDGFICEKCGNIQYFCWKGSIAPHEIELEDNSIMPIFEVRWYIWKGDDDAVFIVRAKNKEKAINMVREMGFTFDEKDFVDAEEIDISTPWQIF